MLSYHVDGMRKKGRAAVSNHSGRYEPHSHEAFDDGWETLETLSEAIPTVLTDSELETNEPLKAEHVMERVRDTRGGREYDATFGKRLRGEGVYADLLAQRFRVAKKRLGFVEMPPFDTGLFAPPMIAGRQMSLF